jgi:hypothetical protein
MSEDVTCWACLQSIRLTSYGWGHLTPPKKPHTASPTKPVRRLKKVEEK